MKAPFLALLSLCLLPLPSSASPIGLDEDELPTLDDLIGQSLTVDDKLFFDWEVVENRSTSSADPLQTTVVPIGADPDHVRLRFGGRENQSLYAEGNDVVDFTFRFKVRSLDPNMLIEDVGLMLRYAVSNDFMEITEFVYDPGDTILDSYAGLAVGPSHKGDHTTFAPRREIVVETHILFGGGINFDTFEPEISYIGAFGEDFSQVTVPEPSTLFLVAGGVAGTLWRRTRRLRAAA